MSARLANLLRQRFAGDTSPVDASLAFLDYQYREICGQRALDSWPGDCLSRLAQSVDNPLWRLAQALNLSALDLELVLLAGLPHEHEGYADIFHSLHPASEPYPTLGLASQLLCAHFTDRDLVRRSVQTGPASQFGLLLTDDDRPFFNCGLRLPTQLWTTLRGIPAWPRDIEIDPGPAVAAGLQQWMQQAAVAQARQAIVGRARCDISIFADNVATASNRAAALCASNGQATIRVARANELEKNRLQHLLLQCLAHDAVPILEIVRQDNPSHPANRINSDNYPGTLILCAETGAGNLSGHRSTLTLQLAPLESESLRDMWASLLPALAIHADQLASRYPFEPHLADQVRRDLEFLYPDPATISQPLMAVAAAVRARSTSSLKGGVELIRPGVDWSKLILPNNQMSQLRDASERLQLQSKVLNEWQFLKGRRGARGLRMLFAGPPGTGKTLSAEVMAQALNVDLLQVDLSRVVSKWIGETEKNLADIFVTAESARAVLFFDEADALFGKRTEVSDAHDRYANLETAYLLSRLERYDGLAILATNYRQNIDSAFSRRLDFIIEFEEPGFAERKRIWACHIPPQAPLDEDVSLDELASLYPIVGGHIRNAALTAAYFAARDNTSITRSHFIEAIRREYEKSGKPYRELSTRH